MSVFYVYAIELDLLPGGRAIYVGHSADRPAVRFRKHLETRERPATSRYVRRHGVRLRPDLYAHMNPQLTRADARAAEAELRLILEGRGFKVYGACRPSRRRCLL